MASDPLRKAHRDFLDGRYARVISLLEPLSLTYRDSHLYYYLIGSSCLFTGDIGGASTYLRRAEQLNFRHGETLAALAAVHVRRGETDKAVQLYFDILEREPDNRFVKKALAFLRSNSAPDRIAELVEKGTIAVLYPMPKTALRRIGRVVLAAAVLGAMALAVLNLGPRAIRTAREAVPARSGVELMGLSDAERKNPVSVSGEFEYVLTEKEALASFERVKDLFRAWNDEAALVEINRLQLSNASPAFKNKAQSLKAFLRDPDFSNVKEQYDFSMVSREPRLFDGVAVVWKGSAANIEAGESGTSFDFLVGYQERKRLEGIVTVRLGFAMRIEPGAPLEILGRIRPAGKGFEIEGLALHELRGEGP